MPARLERDGDDAFRLVFDEPLFAVTRGQSAVVYDAASGSRLLGGGVIRERG